VALTADYDARIIHSDASITDVVAFHLALRVIEATARGIRESRVHDYAQIDLGSGAFFPAVAFVGGWTLQFPAGNFEVRGGNVDAVVNPVAGAFVKMTQSAAYAVTSIGAGGATPEDVADAVIAAAQLAPIHADVRKSVGTSLHGDGSEANKFRSVLVP
jgi:hypothetical protein